MRRLFAFASLLAASAATVGACAGPDAATPGPKPDGGTYLGSSSDGAASGCKPGAFQWATSGGGPGPNDVVQGVAVDKDGNVWVTGTFVGAATWGNVALTALDKVHTTAFFAKLDPSGKVLFARALGGDEAEVHDVGARVRVDADGNAYVVGSFFHRLTIDSVKLVQDNAGGVGALFVLKLDPSGKAVWGLSSSNNGGADESGSDLAVDPKNGDVYVVGSYSGQAEFKNTGEGGTDVISATAASGGDQKVLVAKYSQANGRWEWAKGYIGTGVDGGYGRAVVVNPDDTVTVVGQIRGELSVDGTLLTAEEGTFLAKIGKTDGHLVWATQIDGTPALVDGAAPTLGRAARPYGAAVDAAGNLYVTGEVHGALTCFSAAALADAGVDDAGGGAVTAAGDGDDMFLVKLDPNGAPVWARRAGAGGSVTRGNDLAADDNGGLYVVGFSGSSAAFDGGAATGNLVVARYDASGALQWVSGNDNAGHAGGEGRAIAVRSATSGVFVGGGYDLETKLGTLSLTSAGQDDALVTRLCN